MAHILLWKLKQELFSLDDEIKTLFSTGKSTRWCFYHRDKLYGLTFRSFDIDKYHEELLMSNGWKKQISRYFLASKRKTK
jgi:Zn-dependent oligopeptidase